MGVQVPGQCQETPPCRLARGVDTPVESQQGKSRREGTQLPVPTPPSPSPRLQAQPFQLWD